MGVSLSRPVAWATCLLGLAGCQTYTAAPFRPDAFADQWWGRINDDRPLSHLTKRGAKTAATTSPVAGFSLRDGITLDEAEAVAIFYNAELRIARQRAGVSLARANHAGRWADPTLGVDSERILSGASDPWVVGGTVSFTLPLSGHLAAEKQRATAEHAAEWVRVAGQEWALRQRLRQVWAEWSCQAAKLDLLTTLADRLAELDRAAGRLADAGAISRPAARVFRLERATRQSERLAAETRLADLRLDLHALLGLTPDAPVELVAGIPADHRTESGINLARRNYEIRAAAAEYETAERTLRREIRAQYPDVTIGPGFGTDEGDSRALFGVLLPLPLWNRNRQGVAEATASRELARTRLEAAIEQQTSAFASARLHYDAAVRQRRLIEADILPVANEQADDAERLARLGNVDTLLLLDAFTRQHDANVSLLDATLTEFKAQTRLRELAGEDPRDVTTPQPTSHSGDQ